jgi:hypothetical protein
VLVLDEVTAVLVDIVLRVFGVTLPRTLCQTIGLAIAHLARAARSYFSTLRVMVTTDIEGVLKRGRALRVRLSAQCLQSLKRPS